MAEQQFSQWPREVMKQENTLKKYNGLEKLFFPPINHNAKINIFKNGWQDDPDCNGTHVKSDYCRFLS